MKFVYMGTPDFSVLSLERLIGAGHKCLAAVTRADRAAGRGKKIKYSPVKEKALELGIPVLQPEKVKNNPEFIGKLRELEPDVIVVAAYGRILPPEVLEIPSKGCLNIHASLLPRWRGAAPIQRAIMAGDRVSGVTIMKMDEGLDTGDMLIGSEVAVTSAMNAGELHDLLAETGAELIVEALRMIENGSAVFLPQPDEGVTYAEMLSPGDERIDWSDNAEKIADRIRGLYPFPGAYFVYDGKKVKTGRAAFSAEEKPGSRPGEVIAAGKEGLKVAAGRGTVSLFSVKPQGKREMDAVSFINGYRVETGSLFQ